MPNGITAVNKACQNTKSIYPYGEQLYKKDTLSGIRGVPLMQL